MKQQVSQNYAAVPGELISRIVSYLDSTDSSILQSLSLSTSTHFLETSQSLLFISYHTPPRTLRLERAVEDPNVPLSFLSSCSSKKLKGLQLFNPWVASMEATQVPTEDVSEENGMFQLEKLNMCHSWNFDELTNLLLRPQTLIDLAELRALDVVTTRPADYNGITQVLKACRALREFNMSISPGECRVQCEFAIESLAYVDLNM